MQFLSQTFFEPVFDRYQTNIEVHDWYVITLKIVDVNAVGDYSL